MHGNLPLEGLGFRILKEVMKKKSINALILVWMSCLNSEERKYQKKRWCDDFLHQLALVETKLMGELARN